MESIQILIIFLFIGAIILASFKGSGKHKSLPQDTIPEKYINFPVYNGKINGKLRETSTDKYDRLTIFYKGKPNPTYIDQLYMMGFEKGSEVRYDKNNTYVIFEKIGSKTKVAYHIKKQ